MQGDTLPKLLIEKCNECGDKVAVRKKDLGVWHTWTWRQLLDEVKYTALGLAALGLSKKDRVVLLSDNEPEIVFSTFAIQVVGGLPLALFPDLLKDQVGGLINLSKSRFVIAGDQEQVDKIIEVKDLLPSVEKVIYIDPKGMRNYRHPYLLSFEKLKSMGKKYENKHPSLLKDLVESGKCEDVATLCLTSGTGGPPKLTMLSHKNLIFASSSWVQVDPSAASGEYVSILPFAWIGEQINVCLILLGDFVYDFPEEPETAMIDLREIGPTRIGGPPRMYEKICSDIMFKAGDSTWLKRRFYDWGMKVGRRVAELKLEKKPVPLHYRLLEPIFYWLVYRPILDMVGLKKTEVAYMGGGALGSDYFLFFRALRLNLKELYALTATSCVACMHRDDDVRIGTSGTPVPGVEVKVSDKGEIMVRGENVCSGYYKNPEDTAKALVDGWFYTGDTGLFEEGHLVIIDRMEDVTSLADGSKFSPVYIENRVKFSPLIKEAVVYGKEHPYVVAILNIDYENVSKWAERKGILYTDYTDLSQKPEVYDFLEDIVADVNNKLPFTMRVRKFTSLPKELDADDFELTRTMKLRRGFVYERYSGILNALYSDRDKVDASISVVYSDGRKSVIRASLQIREVESEA